MEHRTMMSAELCDDVFTELCEVRGRIQALSGRVERGSRVEGDFAERYERHLTELAAMIEWKLQILSHACGHEWAGSADFEDGVSVGPMGASEPELAGGFVGG